VQEFDKSELCDRNGRPLKGSALELRLQSLRKRRRVEELLIHTGESASSLVDAPFLDPEEVRLLTLATFEEQEALKGRLKKLEEQALVAQSFREADRLGGIVLASLLVGAIAGLLTLLIRPAYITPAMLLGSVAGGSGRAIAAQQKE
jgi:hypothetical protein